MSNWATHFFIRTTMLKFAQTFGTFRTLAKTNWGSASDANITESFYWKTQHITSLQVEFHCKFAGPSAVRNTDEWAVEKIKTVPHMSRKVYTAIINLCSRNILNFITMFSNKTPQIEVNLDYTILEQEQFENNWRSNCAKTYRNNAPPPNCLLVLIKKKALILFHWY